MRYILLVLFFLLWNHSVFAECEESFSMLFSGRESQVAKETAYFNKIRYETGDSVKLADGRKGTFLRKDEFGNPRVRVNRSWEPENIVSVPANKLAKDLESTYVDGAKFPLAGKKRIEIEDGDYVKLPNGQEGRVYGIYSDGTVEVRTGKHLRGPSQSLERFIKTFKADELTPSIGDLKGLSYGVDDRVMNPEGKALFVRRFFADGTVRLSDRSGIVRGRGFRGRRVPQTETKYFWAKADELNTRTDKIPAAVDQFPLAGKKKISYEGDQQVLTEKGEVVDLKHLYENGQAVVYDGPSGRIANRKKYYKTHPVDSLSPRVEKLTLPKGYYGATQESPVRLETDSRVRLASGKIYFVRKIFADGRLEVGRYRLPRRGGGRFPQPLSHRIPAEDRPRIVSAKDVFPSVRSFGGFSRGKVVTTPSGLRGEIDEIYLDGMARVELPDDEITYVKLRDLR